MKVLYCYGLDFAEFCDTIQLWTQAKDEDHSDITTREKNAMILTNMMERFHRLVQPLLRLQAAAAACSASGQSTHSTAEVVRAALHLLGTCGSAELALILGKASRVTKKATARIRYPFKMINERQRHCTAAAVLNCTSTVS